MKPLMRVLLVLCMSGGAAEAWDSSKWNPTHATHSYLTECAIDALPSGTPKSKELRMFRGPLIEGANQELHELRTSGKKYGIDLEAKRRQRKGTNEGTDDIAGWWRDSLSAYRDGNTQRAYFLLGIMLHMIEDMGVPAHANRVYHQGNITEFDNFEFMATFNWKPDFKNINRNDPGYDEPWKYYRLSETWAHDDAPNYRDRDSFSKTWTFATEAERDLLANRQGRTCMVVNWTLISALKIFKGR